VLGIAFEFILFALTLAGIALLHRHTLTVAVIGLGAIIAYKLVVTGFRSGPGIDGLITRLSHEWVVLANLFGLLVGFAPLAQHFHDCRAPDVLPRFLPDDWKGGFVLLLSLVLARRLCRSSISRRRPGKRPSDSVFVSPVFDNIPLTALALRRGGYDWGMLAYAVGFGGSMIWFGSSAGVTLSNLFPESMPVGAWIWLGWRVAVAYLLGFFALLAILGWHPGGTREAPLSGPASLRVPAADRVVLRSGCCLPSPAASRYAAGPRRA
jgi:hypothetical protein